MDQPQEVTMNSETTPKTKYEAPTVKVMDESEVLTAFQVTAAGATMWWAA